MAYEPTIRVLHLPCEGAPRGLHVANTAQALGKLIGGYLEVFQIPGITRDPMNDPIGLCDADGYVKDPPRDENVYGMILTHSPIAGDIVIVRADPEGDFVSLTDDDIRRLRAHLRLILIQVG